MAIEKKLICFARLEEFERQLAAGNILDYSIVFIQDAKKIWTRGTYYDCSFDAETIDRNYVSVLEQHLGTAEIEQVAENIGRVYQANTLVKRDSYGGIAADRITCEDAGTIYVLPDASEEDKGDSDYIIATEQYVEGKLDGYAKTVDVEGTAFIEGVHGISNDNLTYALPDAATGEEDDVIATQNTLKTINGESIIGEGDLVIGSGSDDIYYWDETESEGTITAEEFEKIKKCSVLVHRMSVDGRVYVSNVYTQKIDAALFGGEQIAFTSVVSSENDSEFSIIVFTPNEDGSANYAGETKGIYTFKTINGESIVGSGDIVIEGSSADNVYITYFKVNELQSIAGQPEASIQCQMPSLYEAVVSHKLILVPYDTDEGFQGYGVAVGYVEDLLYLTVLLGTELIEMDLDYNIDEINGGHVVLRGCQDTLVSGTNIKTINGQSVLGSGNIVIKGGNTGESITLNAGENISQYDPNGVMARGILFRDSSGHTILGNGPAYADYDTIIRGENIRFDVNAVTNALQLWYSGDATFKYNVNVLGELRGPLPSGASYNNWRIVASSEATWIQAAALDGLTETGKLYLSGYNAKKLADLRLYADMVRVAGNVVPYEADDTLGTQNIPWPQIYANKINGKSVDTLATESYVDEAIANATTGGGSSSGAYAEVNHGTADTTFTLTPNTFHVWDEVAELNLSFGSETSGVANEYLFQFTSGSTATTLTLPDDIKWANDSAPTIEANMIYQVSVLKGLASVLEFSNEALLIDNHATIGDSGVINFAYPVASDLTISFYGRTTGMPTNMNATISSGEQSVSTEATTILYINSITPESDNIYNYTFDMS